MGVNTTYYAYTASMGVNMPIYNCTASMGVNMPIYAGTAPVPIYAYTASVGVESMAQHGGVFPRMSVWYKYTEIVYSNACKDQ